MNPLRNHPDIRAVAEERAEAFQSIYRRNDPTRRDIKTGLADGSAIAREVVEAHLDLLTDLTRPDSFDALVRVLGWRVGWSVADVHSALRRNWQRLSDLYLVCGLPDLERHEPTPQPVAALLACLEHTEPA